MEFIDCNYRQVYPIIRAYKFVAVLLSNTRIKIFLEINGSLSTLKIISCRINIVFLHCVIIHGARGGAVS